MAKKRKMKSEEPPASEDSPALEEPPASEEPLDSKGGPASEELPASEEDTTQAVNVDSEEKSGPQIASPATENMNLEDEESVPSPNTESPDVIDSPVSIPQNKNEEAEFATVTGVDEALAPVYPNVSTENEQTEVENPVNHEQELRDLEDSTIDEGSPFVSTDNMERPDGVGPDLDFSLPDDESFFSRLLKTLKDFQLKTSVALVLSVFLLFFFFTWINLEWAIMLPMGMAAIFLFHTQSDKTDGIERDVCRYGFYIIIAFLLIRDIGLSQSLNAYKQAHQNARRHARK